MRRATDRGGSPRAARWHAATRPRVEAKAALEQAEELRRVLEELEGLLGR